jgi:hypothetical protein
MESTLTTNLRSLAFFAYLDSICRASPLLPPFIERVKTVEPDIFTHGERFEGWRQDDDGMSDLDAFMLFFTDFVRASLYEADTSEYMHGQLHEWCMPRLDGGYDAYFTLIDELSHAVHIDIKCEVAYGSLGTEERHGAVGVTQALEDALLSAHTLNNLIFSSKALQGQLAITAADDPNYEALHATTIQELQACAEAQIDCAMDWMKAMQEDQFQRLFWNKEGA